MGLMKTKRIKASMQCLETFALQNGLIKRYSENKKIGFCSGEFKDCNNICRKCRKCIYYIDNIDIYNPSIILTESLIPSIDCSQPSSKYDEIVIRGTARITSKYKP